MLQVGFSLKQARPGHVSPVIRLLKAPDETLCPVSHLKAYVTASEGKRSSQSLFVTMVPPQRAAAKVTLKQWFARVPKDVGIQDCPGSSRAAVASTTWPKDWWITPSCRQPIGPQSIPYILIMSDLFPASLPRIILPPSRRH